VSESPRPHRPRRERRPAGGDPGDFRIASDLEDHVPAGSYTVSYLRTDRRTHYRSERLFIWFEIVELEDLTAKYSGRRIYLPATAPGPRGAAPSSTLFKVARIALGRDPQRGERLNLDRLLRGSLFLAKIVDIGANPSRPAGPGMPLRSRVANLIGRVSGGPRP
jgi:hypothetical protein